MWAEKLVGVKVIMKIGVCQREKEDCEKLKKIIEMLILQKNIEILVFTSGESLLANIQFMKLVFLDIEMPKIRGIELGKEIEDRNPQCKIIITSEYPENEKKASYIKSIGFLIKPFEEYNVKQLLRKVKSLKEEVLFLKVYENRILYRVTYDEIKYIYAYNGAIEVVTARKRFRKGISLKKVGDMLDEKMFYQIHRKCIVNLSQIDFYEEGKIRIGKEEIDVSERKKKQFEKIYMQFIREYQKGMKEF